MADREAEVLLTRALQDAYPDAVVLGEEHYAEAPDLLDRFRAAAHAFTVDPVDGTRNFVHGSPDHAVMIAEVRRRGDRAWLDLAARARDGVGGRARCRRTTQRRAGPS